MKQTHKQKTNGLIQLLRGESGFSVLVIIFVMMVLTVIGYSMTRMMATKQKSVPVTAQSSSAFYVAEGGINYAGKYLSDSDLVSWDPNSWPPSEPNPRSKNLGNGSFSVLFDEYCSHSDTDCGTQMCITVTSTGTYGQGERVVTARFCRDQGYGCTP